MLILKSEIYKSQSLKIEYYFYLLFFLLSLNACKKKPVGPQCDNCTEQPAVSNKDVLIGCEGNFGWGNASFSIYNPQSKSVSNNVFQSINGFPLGDVLQSISEINGKLYLVVNNSGKIHVLDTATYQVLATINGFTSPRYICKSSGTSAYVSDLYSNQISVVNLTNNTISSTISVNNWTEEMVFSHHFLWVTCPDTNWIIRIDPTTNTINDTLIVGKGVGSIVEDKNGKIWALSNGGINQSLPVLSRFDATTGLLEQTFTFPSINLSPSNLKIDKNKENLFFLNNGCYRMNILDNSLPTNPVISQNNALFYGLGIHPFTNEIYISDAIDYVQPGKVYRFNTSFEKIDEFVVGTIPQCFWFK